MLVALTREASVDRERSLLWLASDLVRPRDGRVVRFDEVHDRILLDRAEVQSPADVRFEERTDALTPEVDASAAGRTDFLFAGQFVL